MGDRTSGLAPADGSAGEPGSEPQGRGRRRFRWWMPILGVAVLVVAAFGVTFILFLTRDRPGARSVEDAVEEFRSSTATTSGEEVGLRPPAGVYTMTGEGRESISIPPVDQGDGATMPATVEHLPGGCWVFRIDFNEAHWQDWTLCPSDSGLVQSGGQTYQAWDFGASQVSNLATFVCDPPTPFIDEDLDPGETATRTCLGTNEQVSGTTTVTGPLTFVGTETVRIGGVDVEAVHYRQNADISGAQTGSEDVDFWFAVDDAMPLKGERSVAIGSESPIGTVDYTEEGYWQLTDLEPAR